MLVFDGGRCTVRTTPWDQRAIGLSTLEILGFESVGQDSSHLGLRCVEQVVEEQDLFTYIGTREDTGEEGVMLREIMSVHAI